MTIDELQVLITANTSALRNEITKAQSSLTGLSKTSDKTANAVVSGFNFIKASVIGVGISALLNQITGGMDEAISRVDTLNNYSRTMSNLGIGGEASEKSINRLSEALKGLPTRLNDAASAVARLTSANSNIEASTEMYLALNNAILAGGATQEVQASAVEQLTQAYSKNKMEMEEWRSIMTAMPGQIKQIATAMGFASTEALGESLREGTTSMNDFMATMVKLNNQGIDGFLSFEEQARNATGGIETSITNVKTAFTRGLADIMNAIGQSNIASFFQGIARAIDSVVPYITAFVKVCATAVNYIGALFGVKTKQGADNTTKSLENLGTSAGGTTSKGLDKATGSAKKLNKELNGLAGFDEMNVLKENTNSGSSGDSGSSGVGNIGNIDLSGFDTSIKDTADAVDELYDKMMDALKWFTSDMDFDPLVSSLKNLGGAIDYLVDGSGELLKDFIANCLKPLATYTINDALPHFFNSTADAIKDINFDKVSNSLNNLYDAVVPFSENVGEGLLWFYDNVLLPVGVWTINDVVPEFLDMLASGITILNNTIDTVKPAISFLWDDFLSPIAKWTGSVAISALKDINAVLGAIAKSKVASTITTLGAAFVALKASGTTVKGILDKVFKSTENVNDAMANNSKGLGGILKSVTKAMSNFLSPTKTLITNIVNLSSRTKDLSKEVKSSTSLHDKFNDVIDKVKKSANNLKTSIGNVGTSFKNMTTQLKDGINYWYQTSSGIDKLKTGLTGLAGSVLSLQGLSSSLKDISETGANFGNVTTTVVSGISSIASAAMTGASAGGVYGAVIGGIAGTIGVIATGLANWSFQDQQVTAILESSAEIYSAYKEQIDSINNSLQTTITNSQQEAEAKAVEIANAQQLAAEMENFIDVNGRVKSGYEERANVILGVLNEALGTQLSLEGNVIKNGQTIISSKQQFIDVINQSAEAIQKETLLQSYQAQYKAAIDAQTQAKIAYNKSLQEEQTELEKAIKKYEEGKINATELQKVYDEATKNSKNAQEEYQGVLNTTNGIIDGLDDVTKAFADGSYADMKKTVDGISKVNGSSLDETEKDYDKTTKKMKELLDGAKKKSDELSDSFKEFHDKTFKSQFDIDTSPARNKFNKFANDVNNANKNNSSFNFKMNKIPAYAMGGIVDKPTFAMIGEAGKEAVMPLERNTGWIDELATRIASKGGTGGTPMQIVIKLGEETIFNKLYENMSEKAFETNGEVFV